MQGCNDFTSWAYIQLGNIKNHNIIYNIKVMKKYIIPIILTIILLIIYIVYKQITYTHITVQFHELRPIEDKIPVYYKGIVIGKATEKKHTDDYNHTLIKVVLYPKNLHLPLNTEVELRQLMKNKKHRDYLELLYPETPSDKLIADGSYLKGYTTLDMETFIRNQRPEDMESIKKNLSEASENLNTALGGLSDLFVILQDTVNENRANMRNSTSNIQKTTANVNQITAKVSNSINQKELEDTLDNINTSINNIKQSTTEINTLTSDINRNMPTVSSTIENTNNLIANTNAITCGIRQTLRKRFGGLRLIFGKTINEPECRACGN